MTGSVFHVTVVVAWGWIWGLCLFVFKIGYKRVNEEHAVVPAVCFNKEKNKNSWSGSAVLKNQSGFSFQIIGVQHTSGKSGCKLVTLFGSDCDDCLSAVLGVQPTSGKSGCKLVTLFGGYSYDGFNAAIGVQHTEVPNLGTSWSRFLAVTLMMVWMLL